ncbi:hypothetical protein PIB30_007925 [Stylosanthes scabra]|uniref:Uncharacterized protein n=1 Tax=Stylosanthes scabra TaxID=79078 RepID=A0ABU6S4T6_9FABA|nr:hypothetical protein [Stylosanthes scabra]
MGGIELIPMPLALCPCQWREDLNDTDSFGLLQPVRNLLQRVSIPNVASGAAHQGLIVGGQEIRGFIVSLKDEVWTRIAGGRKRGRIYGMGVVPSHNYAHLFSDPDDDDTASGPLDLKEQYTLFNREISQQAEAHAQRVAVVEAIREEKVRTLESTVQTQSQEMRSSGYSVVAMPNMPPPLHPPPPPPHA